jgi:imidazole glycerol-phosphate synthase subunit HisF
LHIIEAVASQVFIPLTVGGGVRTVDDVRRLLNPGADKTSFNSAAIANPQVIFDASKKYDSQCIVVAIDAKKRSAEDELRLDADGKTVGLGWYVYSHGGRKNTGRDAVSVPVIASGGVGTLEHLADGIQIGGADAVLATSIFHYGEFTVQQAKQHMHSRGIPVRL